MDYQEMYREIADNHAEHWGGEFAEMVASDKRLKAIAEEYPEIFAKAQEDFNAYLRSL